VLILTGITADSASVRNRAQSLGIQVHIVQKEKDLEAWRR